MCNFILTLAPIGDRPAPHHHTQARCSWSAFAEWARQFLTGLCERREKRRTEFALWRLNDHLLRDLGLDRSEIGSLAAECHGYEQVTRVRALSHRRA